MNHAGSPLPRLGGLLPSVTRIARLRAAESSGAINGASTWDTRGNSSTRRAELRRRGMSSRHDSAAYYGRAARKDVQARARKSWGIWARRGTPKLADELPLAGVESRPCLLSLTTQPSIGLVVPMRGGLRAS